MAREKIQSIRFYCIFGTLRKWTTFFSSPDHFSDIFLSKCYDLWKCAFQNDEQHSKNSRTDKIRLSQNVCAILCLLSFRSAFRPSAKRIFIRKRKRAHVVTMHWINWAQQQLNTKKFSLKKGRHFFSRAIYFFRSKTKQKKSFSYFFVCYV